MSWTMEIYYVLECNVPKSSFYVCWHKVVHVVVVQACSVMSSSVTLWTVAHRLLCPLDFPGKSIGVDCHFFSRGSSQPRDQTHVFYLLRGCLAGSLPLVSPGKTLWEIEHGDKEKARGINLFDNYWNSIYWGLIVWVWSSNLPSK